MKTATLIEVLQAFDAGRLVQMRDNASYAEFSRHRTLPTTPEWKDVPSTHRWNAARFDYRVKPFDPITLSLWAAVNAKGEIMAADSDAKEIREFARLRKLSVVQLTSKFLPSA
jgi:hypothetical protein